MPMPEKEAAVVEHINGLLGGIRDGEVQAAVDASEFLDTFMTNLSAFDKGHQRIMSEMLTLIRNNIIKENE